MQLDKAEYNRKKPLFATNIRVSDDTKKRLFIFSHNNSLNRESKHRLKASCFGETKERAEARAWL